MSTSKVELIENLIIFLNSSFEDLITIKTLIIIKTLKVVENVKKSLRNLKYKTKLV